MSLNSLVHGMVKVGLRQVWEGGVKVGLWLPISLWRLFDVPDSVAIS